MNAMCRWHMAATSSKTGCNLTILPPRAKSAIESYIVPIRADAYGKKLNLASFDFFYIEVRFTCRFPSIRVRKQKAIVR